MTEKTHTNTFKPMIDAVEHVATKTDNGLEAEPDDSNPESECPLDPAEVRFGTTYVSVEQLVSQIRNGEIYWSSDVQRASAWSLVRQSRLIESLLLRIPIPVFYAAADENYNWLVVDGVQRLSAIYNYVTGEFPLDRLEYFVRFGERRYCDLPRSLQRRINETQLVLHIVEAGTPEHIKSNIFRRIDLLRFDADEAAEPSSRITNVQCVGCI